MPKNLKFYGLVNEPLLYDSIHPVQNVTNNKGFVKVLSDGNLQINMMSNDTQASKREKQA